jgi:hypothetical protein
MIHHAAGIGRSMIHHAAGIGRIADHDAAGIGRSMITTRRVGQDPPLTNRPTVRSTCGILNGCGERWRRFVVLWHDVRVITPMMPRWWQHPINGPCRASQGWVSTHPERRDPRTARSPPRRGSSTVRSPPRRGIIGVMGAVCKCVSDRRRSVQRHHSAPRVHRSGEMRGMGANPPGLMRRLLWPRS